MTYICVKLVSGDELIGKLDGDDPEQEFMNLTEVVKIHPGYDHDGNFGITFHTFMSYSEQTLFTFARKHIIVYSYPTENMIKYYEEYRERYENFKNGEQDDMDSYEVQSKTVH